MLEVKRVKNRYIFVVNDTHKLKIDNIGGVLIDNDFDSSKHDWTFEEDFELPENEMVCIYSHNGLYDPWSSDYEESYYMCQVNGTISVYYACDIGYAPILCASFEDGEWVTEECD